MTNPFFRVLLFSGMACGMMACNNNPGTTAAASADANGLASFNKDSLAANIKILSSDSFEGRRPFTEGETRTVDYLTKSYARLGLEPGNGAGFTQDVPLVEISPAGTPSLKVQSPKGNIELQAMKDFVIWTERPDSIATLSKEDILFACFGAVAPEYN